jgi:hypothetical protein
LLLAAWVLVTADIVNHSLSGASTHNKKPLLQAAMGVKAGIFYDPA